MAQVEWIKIRVDTFEDEKIRLIESLPEGDALIVIWFKLLAQAGKTNDGGYIYLKEGTPYTPQMLSIIFNRPQAIIDLALKTFVDFGMIEITEKGIYIVNWEKHQNINGLERIREQTRERVRKYRERRKQEQAALPPAQEESNVTCNVTETDGNALDKETEEDKEKDKDREEKEKRKDPPKQEKPKRQKENLCSFEDVQAFVESYSASNPLPIDQTVLIKYIDCLRLYRKTARISTNVVKTQWAKWSKFPPVIVEYAMRVHLAKHDDKPEEYTLAIMRNTNEHEARRGILILKNKTKEETGNEIASIQHGGNKKEDSNFEIGEGYYDQFDIFAN